MMKQAANRPCLLTPNPVRYLIPGGGMVERFLGYCPEEPPVSQLWVASTVQSVLPGAADSLSYLAGEGAPALLTLLREQGDQMLGADFVRQYGNNTGVLLKLLNSAQRLLVQTHPDKALAKRYFHSPYGKTEAWYVLETQHGACIYAGFQQGVTPELFRKLIEAQDTEKILSCLHRFEISPGDVVFIPGGMPHAMGAGSLVAEIQEPTDITLRAERIRPDGSVLPPESLHSGIGMDGLIECFRFDCRDQESTRRTVFVTPTDLGKGEQQLIGPAQTDCFGLRLVTVPHALKKQNSRFVIGLTLGGSGTLTTVEGQLRLHRGSEFFIPNTVQEYSYTADPGETPLVLLECDPPALAENE